MNKVTEHKLMLGKATMGPKDYDENDERTYPAQSAEQEAADRLADDEAGWVRLITESDQTGR